MICIVGLHVVWVFGVNIAYEIGWGDGGVEPVLSLLCSFGSFSLRMVLATLRGR